MIRQYIQHGMIIQNYHRMFVNKEHVMNIVCGPNKCDPNNYVIGNLIDSSCNAAKKQKEKKSS